MKSAYVKPIMNLEAFKANEFIAACYSYNCVGDISYNMIGEGADNELRHTCPDGPTGGPQIYKDGTRDYPATASTPVYNTEQATLDWSNLGAALAAWVLSGFNSQRFWEQIVVSGAVHTYHLVSADEGHVSGTPVNAYSTASY